ncbi:MAG: GNAT family N-acetyltransferase [Candidatus Thermoplasmatota archaeon]
MPMKIRLMEEGDSDEVRELDSKAFSMPENMKRKKDNVLSCLKLNPESCFVVEEEDIIGYIFSRKWGEIGWIGTFGVHPAHQGQGIGKRLLAKAKNVLEEDCSVIGLTTPIKNKDNIGMYLSQGFSLADPTFRLKKELSSSSASSDTPNKMPELEKIENLDEEFIRRISNLSRSIVEGLDYKTEIKRTREDDWDEILSFEGESFEGFSIVRTSSMMENQDEWNHLQIKNLIMDSNDVEQVAQVIKSLEVFATRRDLDIVIPVNKVYPQTLQHLVQDMDYQLTRLYMRMLSRGNYKNLKGVDLSIWGM